MDRSTELRAHLRIKLRMVRVPKSEGKYLGYLGDFLTGHFFPQGPMGLKGDKGPPGPVGASVSINTPAEGRQRDGKGCVIRAWYPQDGACAFGEGGLGADPVLTSTT